MTYDSKPKAVVVASFQHGDTTFNLTEKAAVTVYASGKFKQALMPGMVTILADLGCPVCQEIVNSQAWADVNQAKVINREREKIAAQQSILLGKAQKLQRAALDQLIASGMTEEQAKGFLKVS